MADNLPLIPEKGSECTDVRPVLREVFRELDYLPPLILEEKLDLKDTQSINATLPNVENWEQKYQAAYKDIWNKEEELKHEHARRISREPLPNIFKLQPRVEKLEPQWKVEHGLLKRRDLVPNIEDDAGRDTNLWIRNTLNASSCDVNLTVQGTKPHRIPPTKLIFDYESLESLSMGTPRKTHQKPLMPTPKPLSKPMHAICVPEKLEFVNFTVGKLHTQSVRVKNLSKFDIRLSVKLPSRTELRIALAGEHGMHVSPGGEAEFRVSFRAADVRALFDKLLVRISIGGQIIVPIVCHMTPPILNILIPSSTSSTSFLSLPSDQQYPEEDEEIIELGTRLLGDVHSSSIVLSCFSKHASFFLLNEDAWFEYNLDCLTSSGMLRSGPFVVGPVWWRGGGTVRGAAWCSAPCAGLHTARLVVLSTTAVARSLHVLADTLHFSPRHITVQAHEKDYDIMSEDDPDCEYYVHLNSAFPNRELSATVEIVNHSPIQYSYYWNLRPWGSCCCWEEFQNENLGEAESDLCVGAKETKALAKEIGPEYYDEKSWSARRVWVEPERGEVPPRSTQGVTVRVPDVGGRLGVQRAVLVLILRNIPKESFPPGYEPSIVRTDLVRSDPMPGQEPYLRDVCEVVCGQMEVWWEVVPVRFALDPPVLPLFYSRRLDSIAVKVCATQLYGRERVLVSWNAPRGIQLPPQYLIPGQPCTVTINLTLPTQPNSDPAEDVITLVAADNEWKCSCVIKRECATRHLTLREPRVWLGLAHPSQHLHKHFELYNDTYQQAFWWCDGKRWWGENAPSASCDKRPPCETCRESTCTCAMLRPTHGELPRGKGADICYSVNAPTCDGPVATLLCARRTSGDGTPMAWTAPSDARATLVMYRVLAPQVVLRVLICKDHKDCGCKLDGGAFNNELGTAVLRPGAALCVGARMCARLRLHNITPLSTTVHFDTDHDNTNTLKIEFSANDIPLGKHGAAEVRVVLEARAVCDRKLYVYRALVEHAYHPLYLVVDVAITGLEVTCQIPLGGGEKTDSFVTIKRKQRELCPRREQKRTSTTPEQFFKKEDKIRISLKEKICDCKFTMKYIPPERKFRPEGPYSPEIVTEPPSLTRMCSCEGCGKPVIPDLQEPFCLQFINVPLRTVRTRTLKLYNESAVAAHWSVSVRRWPRVPLRTLNPDKHASEVSAPGVMVWWERDAGELPARGDCDLVLHVYADCWGLYLNQILVQMEHLDPIVLDVWIEVVGSPLVLPFKPMHIYNDEAPTMWMSAENPERMVRANNISRSSLTVHTYVVQQYDHPSHTLPFRLYLRWYDIPTVTCPCCELGKTSSEEELTDVESIAESVDTWFEVYLAPDYGLQVDTDYTVSPSTCTIPAGESAQWSVHFSPPAHLPALDVTVLFRILADDYCGPHWWRREPSPLTVTLRAVERGGRFAVSRDSVCVSLCALDLPPNEILRIRRRFHVLNTGNGNLEVAARTNAPWCLVVEQKHEGERSAVQVCGVTQCCCLTPHLARSYCLNMRLPPDSTTELCLEVSLSTSSVLPTARREPALYPPCTVTRDELVFYDNDNVLMRMPLLLELEYPVIQVNPTAVSFDYVCNGDTRKTYFTVSHTSQTATLYLCVEWEGHKEFEVYPRSLCLQPGASSNVYVMYKAVYRTSPAEGIVHIYTCESTKLAEMYLTGRPTSRGSAGAWGIAIAGGTDTSTSVRGAVKGGGGEDSWCRTTVGVRAKPSHDYKCHQPHHDYTDDKHLFSGLH